VTATTHHGLAANCRNCNAALPELAPPPRFCTQCGQETALHPPSLGEFLHEFIGHYIALEGALWKTLALLVLQPGRLTQEYFAGRRRRYVLPLRLYLTASFLFFVVVKFLPGATLHGPDDPALSPQARAQAAHAVAEAASAASAARAARAARGARNVILDVDVERCADVPASCNRLQRAIARNARQWKSHPDESARQFSARIGSAAPYALFLMLPLFASIVMAAYRNRRMVYGEHVVFGLHLHAFWFIAMLAVSLLPDGAALPALLIVFAYGSWALRRVYGGRWGPTLLRAVFISGVYLLLLLLGTLALLVGAWLLG